MKTKPLKLGTTVKPYGKVLAVAITGGERYYFLQKGNLTSFMPADLIEEMVKQ